MAKRQSQQELQDKVDEFLDSLYLDVQCPTGPGAKMSEDYAIKMITKFIISICTAWWSILELIEYVRNKKSFREFLNDGTTPD
jgi:hypothetical protein